MSKIVVRGHLKSPVRGVKLDGEQTVTEQKHPADRAFADLKFEVRARVVPNPGERPKATTKQAQIFLGQPIHLWSRVIKGRRITNEPFNGREIMGVLDHPSF
jgi:hypothetical protein